MSFWLQLFDTAGFMPPSAWAGWPRSLVQLHHLSDLLLFLAYISLSLLLACAARVRLVRPYRVGLWLAVATLTWTGITHLLTVVTFYVPIYRSSGLVKAIAAGLAWATVGALILALPRWLAAPRSGDELLAEVQRQVLELQVELAQARERIAVLTSVVEQLAEPGGERG